MKKRQLVSLSLCLVVLCWVFVPQAHATSPTVATSGDASYVFPATVTLKGSILDQEGGNFTFEWLEAIKTGTKPYCAGSAIVTANVLFDLPDCTIDGLKPGQHTFTLSVTDVAETTTVLSLPITITLTDAVAPTLAPVADPAILWPPNNKLRKVVVTPNAADNSGDAPTLTATVTSSEPVKVFKKWRVAWDAPVFNEDGTITFYLPAQRLGRGTGRIYTITITATDASNNSTSANVYVRVPHDSRKVK